MNIIDKLRALNSVMPQHEIASEINCTQSFISQLLTGARARVDYETGVSISKLFERKQPELQQEQNTELKEGAA